MRCPSPKSWHDLGVERKRELPTLVVRFTLVTTLINFPGAVTGGAVVRGYEGTRY